MLTLWGNDAEKSYEPTAHDVLVIAVKRAKVAEFSGVKNISVHHNTIVRLDPAIEDTCGLRHWNYYHRPKDDLLNISIP